MHEIWLELRLDRFLLDSDRHLDAGGTKGGDPGTGNPWIGILHTHHDSANPSDNKRIDARRRAAMMRARFERDEDRRALCCRTSRLERHDLGMSASGGLGGPDSSHLPITAHEHCTNPRIGRRPDPSGVRQLDRFAHPNPVVERYGAILASMAAERLARGRGHPYSVADHVGNSAIVVDSGAEPAMATT
jgi:hypothetical protein